MKLIWYVGGEHSVFYIDNVSFLMKRSLSMTNQSTMRELTLNELYAVSGGTRGLFYDVGHWVGKLFR